MRRAASILTLSVPADKAAEVARLARSLGGEVLAETHIPALTMKAALSRGWNHGALRGLWRLRRNGVCGLLAEIQRNAFDGVFDLAASPFRGEPIYAARRSLFALGGAAAMAGVLIGVVADD